MKHSTDAKSVSASGARELAKKETLTIKIPAGAVDGGRVRLKGKGGQGVNGGPAGDLLVNIKIGAHPLYQRDKADVLMDLPVTFAEAASCGSGGSHPRWHEGPLEGTRWVPGWNGSHGVRGKGAPKLGKGSTGNGDLRVAIKIAVPKTLNDEQKKALEAFQEATKEEVRAW